MAKHRRTDPPPPPRDAPLAPPRRSYAPHLLLLILAAATTFRFFDLTAHGLWQDEFYSLASSAGRYPDLSPLRFNEVMTGLPSPTAIETARPWHTIWPQLRHPATTHPPLYILALRAWRETIGPGDAAGRALSAVCSVLALLLLYDTARRLYGTAPALWSAALMAVAWPQVHYAQDLRPYAFLLALGMAAMNLLVRIEQAAPSTESLDPRPQIANRKSQVKNLLPHLLLALTLVSMALTHYFSIGALLAIGLYALIRFRGRLLRQTLLTLTASAALFLLLWGSALWSQRHSTDYSFLRNTAPRPVLTTLSRLDQLPVRYLIDHPRLPYAPFIGATAILALACLTLRRQRDLLLPLLWLTLTASAIALLDLLRSTQHLHFMRYTVLASPGLYLLLPAALLRTRPWLGHAASALLVALCIRYLPHYYALADYRESWRGLGVHLAARAAPHEPLVFAAPTDWYAQSLCVAALHYAHDPRRPVLILDRPATPALLDTLTRHRPTTIWLTVGHEFGQQVSTEQVQRLFPGASIRPVDDPERFSTADVFRLELAPLPP